MENTKGRHFFVRTMLLIGFLVGMAPSLLWAGAVTERVRGTLDNVIDVLNDPAFRGPDHRDKREVKIRAVLREVFDEEEIAKRALGRHWQERSEEERKEFTALFIDLLEKTYFKKIDTYLAQENKNFSKEDILYLGEKVKEPYAVVETRVKAEEGKEIPVYYRMKNSDGQWLVCDIAVEGVSIVRNYRAQFDEIIANSSYEDLIARLKKKEESKG